MSLIGCASLIEELSEDANVEVINNNMAVLASESGDSIGLNVSSVADLRETYSVTSPSSDFSVSTAYVMRASTSSSYLYYVIPVENISSTSQNGLFWGVDVSFRDASGNELDLDYPNVLGSIHTSSSGSYSIDHIQAGEDGYIVGSIYGVNFDEIASVEIQEIGPWYSYSQYDLVTSTVLPVSYTVDYISSYLSTYTITVENESDDSITLDSYTSLYVIFLDDNDEPVFYDSTWIDSDDVGSLSAGDSLDFSGYTYYEGTASTIVSFFAP